MQIIKRSVPPVLVGLFATLLAIGSGGPIDVDFMPGSCPNTLNIDKKGVFHVAIVGTASFNVNKVTASTVTLNGISPISWSLLDQTSPLGAAEDTCLDFTNPGPDGHTDLILKFDTKAVAATLVGAASGDCIALHLSTNLGITRDDRVRILTAKRPQGGSAA